MAEEESSGEKSQEPTARRRQQFRDKGQVPRSQDLIGLTVLIIGFGGVLVMGVGMGTRIMEYFLLIYSGIELNSLDSSSFQVLITATLNVMWDVLSLFLFYVWLGAVVVGLIQGRFIIPKEPIKFSPDKLDPVSGFKQKFLSSQPLMELFKGVMKLFFLAYVVWSGVKERILLLPALINADPSELPLAFIELATIVFWRAISVGIVIVVLDYFYQWWQLRQQMMMTMEEVKEEMKSTEGDPKFKSMRRQRQYDIAMGVALKQVPDADVVVTNPTHFAVALKYKREEADAPIVIARGVDFLAFRIREIANANDVAIVENPALARGLYYKTKEGQMIPPEFYSAVAEVLAAVYRRRNKRIRPV